MKKSEWQYGVWCVGVKTRGRTRTKLSATKLGCGSVLDRELAEAIAKSWLKKNMKVVERAEVVVHRVDVSTDSRGTVIENWSPFDDNDNKRWALNVATLVD